jgi:hypothetical protein
VGQSRRANADVAGRDRASDEAIQDAVPQGAGMLNVLALTTKLKSAMLENMI